MEPGKFEGNASQELAEKLYDVTLDGYCDDLAGDVAEGGWFGLILDFEGSSYIVEEDSQGFFTYHDQSNADDARRAFEANSS